MATVLLLDDHDALRTVLALALRRDGFDVLEAASGDEALTACERNRVDIVVADVHLRGRLDGPTLATRIEEMRPGLPVLLISGSDRSTVAATGRPFLAKPFSPGELSAVIVDLLRAGGPKGESGRG